MTPIRRVPGRRGAAAAVAAVAAVAFIAAGPAAAAAPNSPRSPAAPLAQTTALSAAATVGVTGHGWGHGHGLSQYGSEGAARRGYSAAQVLAFYYPGTASAVLSNTTVRVLITERTGHLLFASARPGLQLRDAAGGLSPLDPAVPMWRLAYAGGYLLQRLSGSSWLTLRTSTTPLGFVTASSVREWTAGGSTTDFSAVSSRDYRGELRLLWDGSTTVTVNYVPMESYLRGVVPRESPSSWPAPALQSQSVAARTYSAYQRAHSTGRSFDVYDTTSDQVYGGAAYYATAASAPLPLEAASTDAAIAATVGQVRTYGGALILAQFSSSNGGYTADGGEPYLRAAQDPFEAYSDNPYENWSTSVSASSLAAFAGLSSVTGLTVHRETPSGGHVSTVDLSGSDSAGRPATVTRSGEDFRAHFGWRSTYFSFAALRAVADDFTGDGRSDAAVFRPSTGVWYIRGRSPVTYGRQGDLPVAADYTGDGRTDVAVFRSATGIWYALGSAPLVYGQHGDVPVPADFTGSGRVQPAVFRPSTGTWFILGLPSVGFGRVGDVPVTADFTGDGRADLAVFRPSTGTWYVQGRSPVVFGQSGDVPVARDFTGDGRADIAVFRPSTGTWFVLGQPAVGYGRDGDVPVAADADADGRADVSVFRPSTGTWYIRGLAPFVFGQLGDLAIHP